MGSVGGEHTKRRVGERAGVLTDRRLGQRSDGEEQLRGATERRSG